MIAFFSCEARMKQRIVDAKVQNIFEVHDHSLRLEPRVDQRHPTKTKKRNGHIPSFLTNNLANTPFMNTLLNLYHF